MPVDVVVTDLLLCFETILFAWLLRARLCADSALRLLTIAFFISIAVSSFLGAVFHAFFPDKTGTLAGYIVWILTASSIGVTAALVWCICARLTSQEPSMLRKAMGFAGVYLLLFIAVLLFVNYQFKTVIYFYLPSILCLAWTALVQFLKARRRIWLELLAAVLLSLMAAAAQYLRIGLHPLYFNYNALYHLIQAFSLVLFFWSFKGILK